MFAAIHNLKHKALLFTAYSAGLRVSEVVNLKISDIDSGRMQIRIENAKGKKDRYIGLSVLLLEVLRAYLRRTKPRPITYLFEGKMQGDLIPAGAHNWCFIRQDRAQEFKSGLPFMC